MNEVKMKMQDGTAIPCVATYGLTKQKELGFDDIELAYALSAAWAAGIGTVSPASLFVVTKDWIYTDDDRIWNIYPYVFHLLWILKDLTLFCVS